MTERTQAQTRAFEFDLKARAEGSAGIPVVISSDAVVDVVDGPEILVHTREAIDLRRAPLPIIAGHGRNQVNVGIVDDLQLSDGKLRGVATFGSRPEAAGYRDDVLNRIIRSVSVGYSRVKSTLRKDGVLVTNRWMPTHTALVAEPADVSAGFFRSLDAEPVFELDVEPVLNPATTAATVGGTQVSDDNNAAAGASAETKVEIVRDEQTALETEQSRIRAIDNLCRSNSIDDGVRLRWVSSGASVERVSEDLIAIFKARGAKNQSVANVGLSNTETRRYSLMRAIQACAEQNWSDAGLEAEASRAIGQKMGVVTDKTRFFVPFEVQRREMRRDLTVATTTAGGFLVETANMSFIEILRNSSVAYRMGATQLSGLVGSVTVPKQTGAATNYWLANEATAITESQQVFAQVALSPKTAGAYTEISRQLLLQSSPGAESIVNTDLAQVVALAVDQAVLNGGGSAGVPQGIIGTVGLGTVTGTTLAYAGIVEFQTDTAGGNALFDSSGYVTTPAVAGLLKTRVKFTSTASPIWEGKLLEGSVDGYRAMASNQMPAANLLFGDFSKVVVAEWGVLSVEVNPYANFAAGIIGVRAMYSVDVGVRYPAAFSLATTIT